MHFIFYPFILKNFINAYREFIKCFYNILLNKSDIFGSYTISNLPGVKVNRNYSISINQNSIGIGGCNSLGADFTYNAITKTFTVGN